MNKLAKGVREISKGWQRKIAGFFEADFFRSELVHWVLVGTLLLNLAIWIATFFFIRPADFPIILHYNVYFGVDILGDWKEIYFLPGMSTALALVNLLSAFLAYRQKERIAAYLLLLGAFLVQVGVAIGLACLIRINY